MQQCELDTDPHREQSNQCHQDVQSELRWLRQPCRVDDPERRVDHRHQTGEPQQSGPHPARMLPRALPGPEPQQDAEKPPGSRGG